MTRWLNLETRVPLALVAMLGSMLAVLLIVVTLFLCQRMVVLHRKNDIARAFFEGSIPEERNLGDRFSDPFGHAAARRSLGRAILTTLGVFINGVGLGGLVTAPLTIIWPTLVSLGAFLALCGATLAVIQGIVMGSLGQPLGHPLPSRSDFLAAEDRPAFYPHPRG